MNITKEQFEIVEDAFKKLQKAFETKQPVFITTRDILVIEFLSKQISCENRCSNTKKFFLSNEPGYMLFMADDMNQATEKFKKMLTELLYDPNNYELKEIEIEDAFKELLKLDSTEEEIKEMFKPDTTPVLIADGHYSGVNTL